MPRHSGGHDQHTATGEVGPPAEVHVVAAKSDGFVETADVEEQVRSHEHASARYGEHVGDGVALFLVDLALVGERNREAEPVHAQTDVLQARRFVPFDELRAEHRTIRPDELFDETGHGIIGQFDVVVAEQIQHR